MVEFLLSRKGVVTAIGIVSGFFLIYAMVSQYYFGVVPCSLCFYERYIYFALFFSLIAVVFVKPDTRFEKVLFNLVGLVLSVGVVLAIYHLLVELQWVEATESCKGMFSKASSMEELRELSRSQSLSRCDRPNWYVLGLSATIWNFLWMFIFFLYWCVGQFYRKI